MKIELKKLSLTNFKGIRTMTILFDQVTDIYGDNATGKTTLMDAFLWLFFGKDSTDRKDFEIKTLDTDNTPFHKLDHEVSALILIDGEEMNIRRSFREKWVKKKGSNEAEFSGHSTEFFWNDVPLKESEYQVKVSALIDERVFKMITNTSYFNSLKWQDRREALLKIAGKIEDSEVIDRIATLQNKTEIGILTNALNQRKTIEEFKKEIVSKKRKIKDELELIPARIDEANRSLPDVMDFSEVEAEIASNNDRLSQVERDLMDQTQAEKTRQDGINAKVREVSNMKMQLQQIEFNEKNSVQDKKRLREKAILDKKNDLRNKRDAKSRLLVDYASEEKRRDGLKIVAEDLRVKWGVINKDEIKFSDGDFCCPTCKRAYEADDIDAKKLELTANFNTDKSRRLVEVTTNGKKTADEIEILEKKLTNTREQGKAIAAEIDILTSDISVLEEDHKRLSENEELEVQSAIDSNTEYKGLQEMIRLRNEEIESPATTQDKSALLTSKREISAVLDALKKQLSTKDQRQRTVARIDELGTQESVMAQELANLEGIEFAIEQFTKAKMDTLESRINGRFKKVRFKMFEEQINGGQVEACTTLIDGVPYPDANTASKIQAGLDIINAFSDYYQVHAPVWIDNRESVIRLPATESQLINLFVSATHKRLTVGDTHKELAVA